MADSLVENTIPVLGVASVAASMRFYETLGLQRDWGGDENSPDTGSVSRDGHAIMLLTRTPPVPGCVWIGGRGLIPLWNKLRNGTAIPIIQRPTNQPWALEMKIKDPDGNILWFGTEPLDGIPFGTEPDPAHLTKHTG